MTQLEVVMTPALIDDAKEITDLIIDTMMHEGQSWPFWYPFSKDPSRDNMAYNRQRVEAYLQCIFDWAGVVVRVKLPRTETWRIVAVSFWDHSYRFKRIIGNVTHWDHDPHGSNNHRKPPYWPFIVWNDHPGSPLRCPPCALINDPINYQPLTETTRRDAAPENIAAYDAALKAGAERHFGKFGDNMIQLLFLVTHPDFRRMSFAKRLCRWGMGEASTYDLAVTVMNIGFKGYLYFSRTGFLTVQTTDPIPVAGEDGVMPVNYMAWEGRDMPRIQLHYESSSRKQGLEGSAR